MSFDWLPAYSEIVGLAVALVQRQRLRFCVAEHMVRCYASQPVLSNQDVDVCNQVQEKVTALSAVVLACRDQGRGEKLKRLLEEQAETSGNSKLSAEVMLLDVSSLQSVRSFAQAWNQRPLHGLINNAGIFDVGSSMSASSLHHQPACFRCHLQSKTNRMSI